jgi:ABC-2 type transport system ATP-binding protein
VNQHGDRLALVVDRAGSYVDYLVANGIDHDVVDLRLDEIFEAYVVGRRKAWPGTAASATAIST